MADQMDETADQVDEMADLKSLLPKCLACQKTRLHSPDLSFFLLRCGHTVCKLCTRRMMRKSLPKCPKCQRRMYWRHNRKIFV